MDTPIKDLTDTSPETTTRSHYEKMPGEVVMSFERGDNEYGMEFSVRKLTAGVHFPPDNEENKVRREFFFEASTPYRACVYQGATLEAAISNLLLGMCFLTREGSINPHCPELHGNPVIQHVMEILSEHMAQILQSRRSQLHLSDRGNPIDFRKHATANISWHNEVIAAVGTALAALARVKDL